MALSFSVCVYLIVDLCLKRSRYPTTVVYDDKISTVASIPFPAITICPPVRIASDTFNLTDFVGKHKENWPNSLANVTSEELRTCSFSGRH